jgi:hypothetical protein
VEQWFACAVSIIGTKSFPLCWDDFEDAWEGARRHYWAHVCEAYERAKLNPLPSPVRKIPQLGLLLALCRELQQDKDTFFLACRMVARVMGTDKSSANRWLRKLRSLGFLQEVKKGRLYDPEIGKVLQATIWRYVGNKDTES